MILDLLLDRLNALTGRNKPRVKPLDARDVMSRASKPSCTRCKYYAGAGAESALKCAVNPIGDASTCPDYELERKPSGLENQYAELLARDAEQHPERLIPYTEGMRAAARDLIPPNC